jgi:hypothetical protein
MSRTVRFASAAAAALLAALTTACSDGPTAPASAAAPAAVGDLRAARGDDAGRDGGTLFENYATLRVVNGQGLALSDSVVFVNLGTNARVAVKDNSAGDQSAEKGRVTVKLPWASGTKVRAIGRMSAPYSSRGFVDRTLGMLNNDFGTLAVKYMPMVHATLLRTDVPGMAVAGGGIRIVRVGDGELQAHVLDNQKGDFDPAIGRIQAYYDTDWKVRVTESPIPTGFQAPANWQFEIQQPFQLTTSAAHAFNWLHTPFVLSK